jgi:hypothetical protein
MHGIDKCCRAADPRRAAYVRKGSRFTNSVAVTALCRSPHRGRPLPHVIAETSSTNRDNFSHLEDSPTFPPPIPVTVPETRPPSYFDRRRPSRRPRLSARNVDTSAFILTPSCLARADNRACMLRGTRAMNLPLAGSPGRISNG